MSLENPLTILYNTFGEELAVSASQQLTGSGVTPGILVAGSSSNGVVQFMRVAENGAVFITGSVNASATLAPNTPVSQGLAGAVPDSWYFRLTDGTQVIGTGSSAPVWVSGAVTVGNVVAISDNGGSITVDGTVAVSSVGGTVTIDDGGGSITVDGTVNVGNFPATQTVTGTVTAQINQVVSVSNGGPTGNADNRLWVTGSFTTNFDPSTSATVTEVSSSTGAVTLQAANVNRRALTIFNESTKNLYVKLGSGATTTSFTVKVSAQGYYEVPGNYTGIVTGVWNAANGSAWVTEVLD